MPSPALTLLRTQSDQRLVELARAGHERAFEAIVERYRRPLLRVARRVLPESRAEDALQQALLAAWTALSRGDDVRALRPWLHRIVHHTALNALRVNGYDYDDLREALRVADAGDDELERRAVVRQTLASVAALPERQREALLRTAVAGHSQEEVARDLGLTDNALRQLVHRARANLRAAATALTPLPLVTAVAAGSQRDGGALAERIAELVAAGGTSATLAKAGTAAVLAGTALSGPALVDRVGDRSSAERPAAAPSAAETRQRERPGAAATAPEPVAVVPARTVGDDPAPSRGSEPTARKRRANSGGGGSEREHGRSDREDDESERESDDRDEDRSGPGKGALERDEEDEDRSGPGGGDDDEHEPEPDDDASSGPGSGDDDELAEEVSSGPGGGIEAIEPDEDSDSSGPGGGDDEGGPVPSVTPEPRDVS